MKLQSTIFFTLFGLLVAFSAGGQSYNFVNYSISDGLVHDRIVDLCTDHYGNLWAATLGGGISRFNGESFENITIKDGLASNYVRTVMVDRRGRLWAATAEGISIYDGSEFTNFRVSMEDDHNSVHTLFEDSNGNIWFSSFGGNLGRISRDGQRIDFLDFPKISDNDNIIDIEEDSHGRIWLVSSIQGMIVYEDDTFRTVLENKEFGGFLLSIQNRRDTLWLGTNKGIIRYLPEQTEHPVEFLNGMRNMFIKSIHVIDRNNFWAVSATGIYNYRNGQLRMFGSDQGFTDEGVNVILCDRENNLWFGTDGDGLYQLNSELFLHYNEDHGLTREAVTSIIRDSENNYWFGTFGDGLYQLSGDGIRSFNDNPLVHNKYVSSSIMDKEKRIWFGLQLEGLLVYEEGTFRNIGEEDGFMFTGVRSLFCDSDGRIWIGTVQGLAMYDGQQFHHFTVADGLFDNIIWGISEPEHGRVMIVTREGFNYFQDDRLTEGYYHPEVFNKRINVAIQDNYGNFWIGYSGHGIIRINEETGNYEYITDENGLHSNLIYNLMIEEKTGDIIVGTERGVLRLSLDSSGQIEHIKNYMSNEVFSDLQTLPHSIYQEADGSLWFGTEQGVFKYQPEYYRINEHEPIVYVSDVKLDYHEVDWNEYADSVTTWHKLPYDLDLSYKENNIIVRYFGNSLKNPDQVRYKFRLVGLDDQWSPETVSSEAAFTNLSPGDYRFEVIAANSDGIWNEEPATFAFSIIPPFWQRPWFFVALLVYFIIMITLYNNYRVRSNLNKILTIEKIRQEEQGKVRKRMARDFHDNMGNQLASITMFTNLISLKLKDRTEEVDQLLKNIEKHSKSLFTGTKDFIWSIDPESDNLDNLYTYIKDFGEELFENTEIAFYSDILGDLREGIDLPSGWSRQLVLIFKEAMTNTLKHGGATEVYFHLELNDTGFVLILEDNGNGFDMEEVSKGNGLRNMRSRADQIGGEFVISSTPGTGTRIRFTGQLAKATLKNKVKNMLNKKQQS